MNIKEKIELIGYIFKTTFRFILKYPRIIIPFVVVAFFNFSSLFTLYLAPMYPFKKILGPPIIRFFGKQYLHYPYNFILLPNLFSYVKNFLVNPLVFSIMIAVCAGMIYNYHEHREPSFFRNLNKALRRFVHLMLAMIIMTILTYFVYRLIPVCMIKLFSNSQIISRISFSAVFLVIIAIESLFIYTFLAIMVKRKNILGAVKESLTFSRHLFFVTYLLILIPRLLDFAVSILQRKQLYLMNKFTPDITLLVIALGIIVAIVSDGLVFSLISNLYILKEKAEGSRDEKSVDSGVKE